MISTQIMDVEAWDEILAEIEEKSNVVWSYDHERPTARATARASCDHPPWLILGKYDDPGLISWDWFLDVPLKEVSNLEFISACIKAKPKDTSILGLNLRTDTSDWDTRGGDTSLLDKEVETYEMKSNASAISGIAPLLERFANRVSAEFGIPMPRLFGQLASDLSTSEEPKEAERIATKISMELLRDIEEKSAVRWAGGERPTDYTILKEFPFLVLEKDGLCHAYPSGVARPILSDSEFLAACIKAKPKEAAMDKIKIGDRVCVMKKTGRESNWISSMDVTLGQTGTVKAILDEDCRVRLDKGDCWYYHRDALQLVDGPIQLQPKIAECPHPGRLGVWLTPDRKIRDVEWMEGFWRTYHMDNDHNLGWTKHDSDWTIPSDWVRPKNGPRLPRPKQRERVRVAWDPEDMG